MIDYLSLPFVALADYKSLPQVPGVYFVVSGDRLLYIGKAESGFKSRWAGHHKLQQFQAYEEVKIFYFACSDNISETEKTLIKAHKPLLNSFSPRTLDKRSRPITMRLPIVVELMLALEGHVKERSVTATAENHLMDEISKPEVKKLIWQNLNFSALLHQFSFSAYVAKVLDRTKDFDFLRLREINWSVLFDDIKG